MPPGSEFLLHCVDSGTQFGIVQEDALHTWISKQTDKKLQLPYDQMVRVREQLHKHPDRLQWTLDVGNCWKLQRSGNVISVFRGDQDVGTSKRTLPWVIDTGLEADTYNSQHSGTYELHLAQLPRGNLEIKRVSDCDGVKFVPPWRKGRSAMKIKEFLRGQKIPLHQRDGAAVLYLSGDHSTHAVAVHLEDPAGGGDDDARGRWVVDANFCPRDDLPVTKVVLRKTFQLQ